MTETGLRVVKPGVLTLVQDLGRKGHQHLGLSTGGAVDEHAFLWANRLLTNPANTPALEITLGGLTLHAEHDCHIAITGADCQASINQQPIANWQSHNLKTGDRLQLAYAQSGIRTYLAVEGGFQISETFGSVATVVREQVGGLNGMGSPLRCGDVLPCLSSANNISRQVPDDFIADYQSPLIVRVIDNQPSVLFADKQRQRFYQSSYQIDVNSNNMGLRLNGPSIKTRESAVISEGIPFGTIQIPPDGQPIILLKDRQTIGGYPKLGTVLPLDAFSLAQRQAKTTVYFQPISLENAVKLMRRFYQFFQC